MHAKTLESLGKDQETALLTQFKIKHTDLFKKDDTALLKHLLTVTGLLVLTSAATILLPWILLKIIASAASAFLWFCLINTTIHHHQTHKNGADKETAKKILDMVFLVAVPGAPKRKTRYTRAHLNHHLRPFHETDVDHHYGWTRFSKMIQTPWSAALYFLELTFIGAHMPGWEDDRYMNQVPLEQWNQKSYREVKKKEGKSALIEALWQWGAFLLVLQIGGEGTVVRAVLQGICWGWILPMLLVKNWSHFLGQFQHYETAFLREGCSDNLKTKSFRVPGWLNYLAAGEISGHFLHHLYPEMPYYNIETARRRLEADPEMNQHFLIYGNPA